MPGCHAGAPAHFKRLSSRNDLDCALHFPNTCQPLLKPFGQFLSPRVLLIEDDPNISLIVMRWLTGKGMEVVHTEEAGQAETLCGEDRWDIIISDIELSGFNGP